MFRDLSLPLPDGEQRQVQSFIRDVEASIKAKELFGKENFQNRHYFESQGAVLLSTIDLPVNTIVIAKSVSPQSTYGFVQPVSSERGFLKTVLKEFELKDILSLQPDYPEFWEKVAQNGVVQNIHFGQEVEDLGFIIMLVKLGKCICLMMSVRHCI